GAARLRSTDRALGLASLARHSPIMVARVSNQERRSRLRPRPISGASSLAASDPKATLDGLLSARVAQPCKAACLVVRKGENQVITASMTMPSRSVAHQTGAAFDRLRHIETAIQTYVCGPEGRARAAFRCSV